MWAWSVVEVSAPGFDQWMQSDSGAVGGEKTLPSRRPQPQTLPVQDPF